MINTRLELYQELPKEFSPKDALDKANKLDFEEWCCSRNWIQSVLQSWLRTNRVKRVKRGLYRKAKKKRISKAEKVSKPDHWDKDFDANSLKRKQAGNSEI